MKYRDRTTGQIYTLYELQTKFSNISFPQSWDSTTFDFANVDGVLEISQPLPFDVKNRVEFGGIQLVNGIWTEVWEEVPKFDDPTEQSMWEAECLDTQWGTIRGQRDALLTQTDYTQLNDTPITPECRAAFVTYRQALRDVTSQNDPYNISWPAIPEYIKQN